MSVRIMSAAWDVQVPAPEKITLVCLADFADDLGVCWPSILTIAKRTGLSESSVRRSIKGLSAIGCISRVERSGTSTKYKVHPCHTDTPVTVTPLSVWRGTPVSVTPHPCHTDTLTTNEPPRTTKQRARVNFPEWVPLEDWGDFADMRKKIKKPMTDKAVELTIAKLAKLRDAGYSPSDVLRQSTMNSWQGLFEVRKAKPGPAEYTEGLC